MLKALAVLAATGLAVLGASALAGAARTNTASTTSPGASADVVAVLGKKVSVRPGAFAKAYAVCPKGYHVTGGGAYSGAITEIISSPMPDLRGWFVDGSNTSPAKRTFTHRAVAVCQTGSPTASAAPASTAASLTRQAQTDFATSHAHHP